MPFPSIDGFGIVDNPLVISPFQTNNKPGQSNPAPPPGLDFVITSTNKFVITARNKYVAAKKYV